MSVGLALVRVSFVDALDSVSDPPPEVQLPSGKDQGLNQITDLESLQVPLLHLCADPCAHSEFSQSSAAQVLSACLSGIWSRLAAYFPLSNTC